MSETDDFNHISWCKGYYFVRLLEKIKWLVMYFTGAKYSHFYVNELCWVLKYTNLHWIVWAFWIMRHFRRVLTMLCNSFISWSLICLHSMISTPISLLVFCKSENGCISLGTEESTIQLKKSIIWNFENFHYMHCVRNIVTFTWKK